MKTIIVLIVAACFGLSSCSSFQSGGGGTALTTAAAYLGAAKTLDSAKTPESRARKAKRLTELANGLDVIASGNVSQTQVKELLDRVLPTTEPEWAALRIVALSYFPQEDIPVHHDARVTAGAKALSAGIRLALPSGK